MKSNRLQASSSSGKCQLSWNLTSLQEYLRSLNNCWAKFMNSGCLAKNRAIQSRHSFVSHIFPILKAERKKLFVCLAMFCHQAHLKLNSWVSHTKILLAHAGRILFHQDTALSSQENPSQSIFLKCFPESAVTASSNLFFNDSGAQEAINLANCSAVQNLNTWLFCSALTKAMFLKFLANTQSIILFALSL